MFNSYYLTVYTHQVKMSSIQPDGQFENIQEAVNGGKIFNSLLVVKGGTQGIHLVKYFNKNLTAEFIATVAFYVLFSSAKANGEYNPTDSIKIRFINY